MIRLSQLRIAGSVLFFSTGLAGWMQAAEIHVAPNGNDAWSGSLARPNPDQSNGPFATLDRARAEIRRVKAASGLPAGGIQVVVQGGSYAFKAPLELTGEDSGAVNSPILYRAARGEEVRLSGGVLVQGFQPVTDPLILGQWGEAVRGHVFQADIQALGVTDFGTVAGGGLELFFQDRPMTLSRWPNSGFMKIASILGKTPVDVRGTKGCAEGLFTVDSDRLARWQGEKDAWLHGYWFWDWSDQRQHLKSIDAARSMLELDAPHHTYGYRKGQWFYAYNLLAEIDQPGEWYLDREAGRLYFWPPEPLADGNAIVSVLPTLLTLRDVAHVAFQGFIFEAVRETAITMHGGISNRIVDCTIRNLGGSAVNIVGGTSHGVVACDVYQCGSGGIALSGGDRKTLQAANHFADNNHIREYGRWRPMYSAGISLNGVGNRATHNRIHHAPHQAISFGGNEHLIELNEIHDVCLESNDAGAIYSGRDWTMRGTIIRHNYLHDISGFEGRGCVGVYLDDMYSGTEISGNVFHRVTSAAFVGGGRDCRIENNIFVDCQPAVHVDARAMGWAKYHADEWVKEGGEKKTLSGIRYSAPPYRDRYPQLVNILAEDPWAPRGNLIARNVCVGGRWDDIEAKARPLIAFEDNLIDADPGFVDRAKADFRLKPESPVWDLGFQRIPIERIGLYTDENRTSLPATTSR